MRLKEVIFFIFLLLTTSVFCQSEYLEGDSFGLSGSYNYAKNDNSNSSGFDLVLSLLGSTDIGFQHSSGEIKIGDYYNNLYYSKANSTSNIFFGDYVFKNKDNSINTKVLLGYYTANFDFDYDKTISSSGALVGLGLYPRILKTNIIKILLSFELSYGFLSISKWYTNPGEDDSQFNNTRSLAGGISIQGIISPNISLIAVPFLSKDLVVSDRSVYWGISVRLILSASKEILFN